MARWSARKTSLETAARDNRETEPRFDCIPCGFVFLLTFLLSAATALTREATSSTRLYASFRSAKSLSCLPVSIILVTPNAAVFLVHGTGFITPRAPKSGPQLKQNPWFERFTELGQIKNVPLGQNLEG